MLGAHCRDSYGNAHLFGCEFEGCFTAHCLVTPEQYEAAVNLLAWLAYWGNYQASNLDPHCLLASTECPGRLQDRLPELKRAAHQRKAEIIEAMGRLDSGR